MSKDYARMGRPEAEILALEALGWLAADSDGLERLLAVSGIDPADLRAAADTPGMLTAILDFILSDEQLLLRFCEETSTQSRDIHLARHRLES